MALAPATIILLLVGTGTFLVLVWATVCAATYTLGTVVDRLRRLNS